MYSGIADIPVGWAVCDGGEYTYKGVTTKTPNLIGRFIKAAPVGKIENNESIDCYVKETNNSDLVIGEDGSLTNTIKLEKYHLPEHNHPHKNHTHEITGTVVTITESGELSMTGSYKKNNSSLDTTNVSMIKSIEDKTITTTTSDVIESINITNADADNDSSISITGANHTHTATVTEGTISETTSEEDEIIWNNNAFNIEPNYYSLIFIMKL
jgi:hypothetical protein